VTYIEIEHAPKHPLNGQVVEVVEVVGDTVLCAINLGKGYPRFVWVHADHVKQTKEPEAL
jgi:ribosomal protein L21E